MKKSKKSIEPRNDKNQRHGYWEFYWDGELWYKCYYINGQLNGYNEEIFRKELILFFHL